MLQSFKAHIASNFPEFQSNRLLLACSGGLDSTVLAHLLFELGFDFSLAHVNYKLRGQASDGDQNFVEQLGLQLGVPVYIKQFNTQQYIQEQNVSVQMGARTLRYSWFQELLASGMGNFVLTAHHADDALETFCINLSRSTGIDGLSGIPAKKGNIRRPLLIFERSSLQEYAKKRGVIWREDASNLKDDYLRNKIRHQLVPAIKAVFPNIMPSLQQTQEHLQDSRSLITCYMDELRSAVVHIENQVQHYDLIKIKKLKPLKAHLYELFSPFGFTDWDAVNKLLFTNSGKEVRSNTHRLLRNREELLLKAIVAEPIGIAEIYPLSNPEKMPVELQLTNPLGIQETGSHIVYLDSAVLKGELFLRKWQNGDYFYPLGMKGKKLVSKFFKDLNMSQFQKEDQWLLCAGDQIVWILGLRADERFKITSKTQRILKIEWIK
ncbi:MAG: hypothetical protein RLZZ241_1836 [Bacteroidota bacterium]|jgi:tRNA(Ile)-lysidine synthase